MELCLDYADYMLGKINELEFIEQSHFFARGIKSTGSSYAYHLSRSVLSIKNLLQRKTINPKTARKLLEVKAQKVSQFEITLNGNN